MTQPTFSTRGVVDLGALRTPSPTSPASAPSGAAAANGSYVVDVGEADFQQVVEQSMTAPVVIDFWAEWCGPCKQLSPVLERLAAASEGRWLLAKVDVDANQRLAQAFQVQSIPAVFAVVKGQPLPLFQGALPEAQVRQYVDELLRVAAAAGIDGRVGDAAAAEDDPGEGAPALPAGIEAALDAVDRGDLEGAAEAYRSVLAETPADPLATSGLAQVELLRRARSLDPGVARRAAEHPDDVAAQCAASDADLLAGRVEEAFGRLVETVRRTSGGDRDAAKARLLELFAVVGPEDPRVRRARTALANALF